MDLPRRLSTLFAFLLPLTTVTGELAWWETATFYSIFVRSFADSTEGGLAGDGIGDFDGLRAKLDYLNDGDPATKTDLGVNALWLLPVNESPSYHGYDVTNYTAFEPDYGDKASFQRMVAEAHARGIKVIVDLVMNHTSSQHRWFREAVREDMESPYQDYYVFSDKPKHEAGPWGEPCWHYRDGLYYYGVFWSGMPDLNFRHPAVTEHFRKVARFWLEEIGIDGFRLDAIRFLFEEGGVLQDLPETRAWLAQFREYCQSLKPDVFIVGEAWADTSTVSDYVRSGSADTCFEFDLATAMLEAANFGLPMVLNERLERVEFAWREGRWAAFLANHDKERTLSQLGGDIDKAKLAATLLLTGYGVPFIYYGEEIGMTGRKPDPDLRTPFHWNGGANAGFTTGEPWRAINAEATERNVEVLNADEDSILSHYRKLIRLRQDLPALATGKRLQAGGRGKGLYKAMRRDDDTAVAILINLDDEPLSNYRLALYEGLEEGTWQAREHLAGVQVKGLEANARGGFSNWVPVAELSPRTGYVIELKRPSND